MTTEKKVPQIVACDSPVLMWAFPWAMPPEKKKQKPSQDVPEMRRRAKYLLRILEENGSELYIPSVVISELLAGVDPSKHTKLLAEFGARFFCPAFDIQACALAAKLWQFERGLPGVSAGLPKQDQTERRLLKSDILIVASARIAGATEFFSHDAKCRRLAKEAGMKAQDLPHSSGSFITDKEVEQEEARERSV